ncbi:MAG: hypothetical protein QG635_1062 [Bacteroidota bacterium]|nr:hypothetical protein [Bacteroidota bacterium]
MKINELRNYLLVLLIGGLFFLPYLGGVHLFDWDELNFAEAAREMLVTGDWLTVRIDYQPFHEKPPLFFWLQAISMKSFGINEFAARLPNALTGIFTLLLLFHIGKKMFDERFGLLWVIVYIGSFLPHFYFRTGIIDPVFNLFIFLALYHIYKGILPDNKKSLHNTVYAGVFASIAILTKGPVAYLLIMLCWLFYFIIKRKSYKFPLKQIVIFTLLAAAAPVFWYIILSARTGSNIIWQFIEYQVRLYTTEDAGHGGPIYYHIAALLIGCFPASVVMLRGFRSSLNDNENQKIFKLLMILLLCTVLTVFSIASTKIVHYSSLAYFPITYLAVYAIHAISYRNLTWKKSTSVLIIIFGLIWAFILTALPAVLIHIKPLLPMITDKLTNSMLKSDVGWTGWEYVIGIFYFISLAASIVLFIKKHYLNGFITLFSLTAVTIFCFLSIIAPKIERYQQGPAVEFYKKLKGEDCYIYILDIGNFKYGQYFYSDKPPSLSSYYNKNIPNGDIKEWLLTGNIDKPAYFITTVKDEEKYWENYKLLKLYEKGGYVFFVRIPHQKIKHTQ